MNFDVKFDMDPMTLDADMGVVTEVHTTEDALIKRTLGGKYVNDRVDTIGAYAFYNYSALTSADFTKAQSIGNSAFYLCDGLKTVSIPNVTIIEPNGIRRCKAITEIDLPKATIIASAAFYDCSALVKLILRNTGGVCTLRSSNALTATAIANKNGYIYVPDALVEDYKAATNWSTYADQIKPLSELEG